MYLGRKPQISGHLFESFHIKTGFMGNDYSTIIDVYINEFHAIQSFTGINQFFRIGLTADATNIN